MGVVALAQVHTDFSIRHWIALNLLSSFLCIFNIAALLPSFPFACTRSLFYLCPWFKIKERNHIDLYLKGAWFEFMLGRRLPWWWFSWFYHVAYARDRYFRNPFQFTFIPTSRFIHLFLLYVSLSLSILSPVSVSYPFSLSILLSFAQFSGFRHDVDDIRPLLG